MMSLDNKKTVCKIGLGIPFLSLISFLYVCSLIICFLFISTSISGNAFAGEKAWLGVQVKPLDTSRILSRFAGLLENRGVSVSEVTKGSPAEQMGIKQRDIILAFNYKDILTTNELTEAVSALNPGDRVVILIARLTEGRALLTITGTLGQSPGLAETEQIPKPLEEVKPVDTKISAKTFAPIGQMAISKVVFSPDGRYGLSVSYDTFILWDVSTGRQVRTFISGTKSIYSVAFSPDGRYVLSGSENNTIKLWDVATGTEIRTFTGRTKDDNGGDLINSVVFSPDGRYALSGSTDKTLKLWDVSTGRELRTFTGHEDWVRSVAFSPDGRYALSGGKDKTTWLTSPGGGVYQQRAGSNDKLLILWDVATGREIRQFKGHTFDVSKVAFSPDGRYGLSESDDHTLKLWDVSTGRELRTSKADRSLCFSPDLSYSISPASGGGFTLWDVATGREIRTFTGHAGGVFSTAFYNDGKNIISGGKDGSTRLWDIKTGKEIAQFISLKDGEWLVVTPEGYYNSSLNGHKHLNVRMGNKVYGIDQFYDVFYRPDIVQTKLAGKDISSLITLTIDDAIKSPPPSVAFTTTPKNTDQLKAKVCYKATSTGGGIGEVRLFQNGKLVKSDGFYRETVAKATDEKIKLASMDSAAIQRGLRNLQVVQLAVSPIASNDKGNEFEECQELETMPGENEISVSAFNATNTIQSNMEAVRFTADRKPEEPHLYVLGVGINKYGDPSATLKYAVKDADDFRAMMQKKAAGLYKPQNIHIEGLSDSAATKAGIQQAIQALSAKVKPWDSFILFVASHGVLLENQYYIVTAEYNGSINPANMISSNEIVGMSKNIKSLSQLFIFDTCHAGGVDNLISGLYDARMSVMAKKMGLHIYASAGSSQTALDGYQGNGLFTHTLLKSMREAKTTDSNHNEEVSVVELGKQARQDTMDISKKLGAPQSPNIINFGRDNALFMVQEAVQ